MIFPLVTILASRLLGIWDRPPKGTKCLRLWPAWDLGNPNPPKWDHPNKTQQQTETTFTPFCLRGCLSPKQTGWSRALFGVDALLNALNCRGFQALDFCIDQVKHDQTPYQESNPQHKEELKHPHGTHTHEENKGCTQLGPKAQDKPIQEKSKSSSSSRQPQDQVPRTCNKHTTCYDPQLQGRLIWQCHLPLTHWQLHHWIIFIP